VIGIDRHRRLGHCPSEKTADIMNFKEINFADLIEHRRDYDDGALNRAAASPPSLAAILVGSMGSARRSMIAGPTTVRP
jgi:hypothetical protein